VIFLHFSDSKNIKQEIDFFLVSLPSRRLSREKTKTKKRFETVLKIKEKKRKVRGKMKKEKLFDNFNFSGQTSARKSVNFHQSHCCLLVCASFSLAVYK
jgi:hypothetical protein